MREAGGVLIWNSTNHANYCDYVGRSMKNVGYEVFLRQYI